MTRDGLVGVLQNAFDRMRERAEHQQLKDQVRGQYSFSNVVGQSKAMKDLFELIESVAASEANILIQGENGTGQGAHRQRHPPSLGPCARPVHQDQLRRHPARADRKRAVRLPRRAPSPGASVDKVGLFEMAEGGSLLLDESGGDAVGAADEAPARAAAREFRPIGSDRTVRVDFRLICSTNVDLEQALREGRVREDLYFRINTITLRVPPLRERTEDIPLICNHFLAKFNQRYERSVRAISPAAYHLLIRNRWSGNVRELENAMERAVLVCKTGEIGPDDLPETLRDDSAADRRVHAAAGPHAGGDRAAGHRADPDPDQLEQAGGRAGAGPLPAHAVQQDAQAQDRGRTRTARRHDGSRRSRNGTPASP